MAERSNAAVLKTVVPLREPGVRIPFSPQKHNQNESKACKSYDLQAFAFLALIKIFTNYHNFGESFGE